MVLVWNISSEAVGNQSLTQQSDWLTVETQAESIWQRRHDTSSGDIERVYSLNMGEKWTALSDKDWSNQEDKNHTAG